MHEQENDLLGAGRQMETDGVVVRENTIGRQAAESKGAALERGKTAAPPLEARSPQNPLGKPDRNVKPW